MTSRGVYFFDFDGTLVDSETACARAWRVLWNTLTHQDIPDELHRELTGKTQLQRAEMLLERFAMPSVSPLDLAKRAMQVFHERMLQEGIPLMPGAMEALTRTRDAGFTLALASNSNRDYVTRMLEWLALTPYFERVMTREDVESPKPAPDIYKALLELYPSLPHIAVEDSETGIMSAHRAEVPVLGVVGNGSREEVQNATHVIDSLEGFDPEAIYRLFYSTHV